MINVPKLRKQLGFQSQSAFAEFIGVDQSTVCRWENGRLKPSGPALVLLRVLSEGSQKAPRQIRSAE
jgi:putative transcriptional regulator